MRQIFQYQFKLRKNSILLNYGKGLEKFTFLQSDISNIKDINSNKLVLLNGQKFTQSILRHRQYVQKVMLQDFSRQDLLSLPTFSTPIINSPTKSNAQKLILLTNQYQQLKSQLYNKLKIQNLIESFQLLDTFNCLDVRIWQKVFSLVTFHYRNLTQSQRAFSVVCLGRYMRKFQHTYQSNKINNYKFLIPQNYLNDLVDFRHFLKNIEFSKDYLTQQDDPVNQDLKLNILDQKIFMIIKSSKKVDINMSYLQKTFGQRNMQMLRIVSQYNKSEIHTKLLYKIYFIYSLLNYRNAEFYKEIQLFYQTYLKAQFQQQNFKNKGSISEKSKQLNKLLSIWKFNQQPNLKIYQEIIKPFITQLLKNRLEANHYSNIAMNLLTAGIKDTQILDKLVRQSDEAGIPQDQFQHMLKHYLNVTHKQLVHKSSYKKCSSFQNPQILNYLCCHVLLSSCLRHPASIGSPKPIQHHSAQSFWISLFKQIFTTYKTYKNIYICNYQIDYLIVKDKQLIAIQIQGGHYYGKEQGDLQYNGKKIVKQQVLKAYGIRIVKLHCQDKYPSFIMQTKNKIIAKTYILHKISQDVDIHFA